MMGGFGAAELQAVIALLQNLSGLATVGFFMWLVAVHVVPWVVPFWALVRLAQAGFKWLELKSDESRKLRGLRNAVVIVSAAPVTDSEYSEIAAVLADGIQWREQNKSEVEKSE